MTLELHRLYRPLTAQPFLSSPSYAELPPGPALAPYVRCYWGTAGRGPDLVVPDTCMDVIFRLDGDGARGVFCGMDVGPSFAADSMGRETFAIRFFPWAAALFAEPPLSGTVNGRFDAEAYFPGLAAELAPLLEAPLSLGERARRAERVLLRRLDRAAPDATLLNAVDTMVRRRGTMGIAELCAEQAVSRRKLERVFDARLGVSPKTFAGLVRYQLLWRDLCGGARDMLDLTEKYGYYDQAHLLNDFRRRHGMTPAQALRRIGL